MTRFDACLFVCGAGGALSCRGLEVGVEVFCGRKLDGGGVDGIFGDWRLGGGFGGVVGAVIVWALSCEREVLPW